MLNDIGNAIKNDDHIHDIVDITCFTIDDVYVFDDEIALEWIWAASNDQCKVQG